LTGNNFMEREEKLRAAKEKLAKFQKKKVQNPNQVVSVQAEMTVLEAEPIPSNEAPLIEYDHANSSAAPIDFAAAISSGEGAFLQEYQEPAIEQIRFTANEQYYYDLLMTTQGKLVECENELQSSQFACETLRNELDHMSLEYSHRIHQIGELELQISQLQIQKPAISSPKPDLQAQDRILDLQRQIADLELNQKKIHELHDWSKKEEQRLALVESHLQEEKIKLEEERQHQDLREELLTAKEAETEISRQHSLQLQAKLEQGQEWFRMQEQELKLDYEAQSNNDLNVVSSKEYEEAQSWITYYQSKFQELEIINENLNQRLLDTEASALPDQVAPKNDSILDKLEEMHKLFAEQLRHQQNSLKGLEASNDQIVKLLDNSDRTSSTEFCRAVTEMSR
jgi:hypothetical protein